MFSFAKKQIDSPSLYQGIMLLLWKYQSNWKGILSFDKKLKRSYWPVLFAIAYWAILYIFDGLKPLHISIVGATLGLNYYNRATKKFLNYYFPLILTAILYDSMRLYTTAIRSTIHVAEPYLLEKSLFGISINGQILTPNEFWVGRTNAFLDLMCGFAYLAFTLEYILFSFFLYGSNMYLWVKRMNWGWLTVNIMGFITYHLYAAAPPWYVADYGMGPANLAAAPSAAGAARFDQLLGTNFFEAMYGSSANIFGAIPSLHVAYPFIAVFIALQIGRFRAFSIFWSALMCFAAVYLNHHYIIDILLGLLYAYISVIAMEKIFKAKSMKA